MFLLQSSLHEKKKRKMKTKKKKRRRRKKKKKEGRSENRNYLTIENIVYIKNQKAKRVETKSRKEAGKGISWD